MRKHYTLYNIYNATRTLLVIAALLIAGGGSDVWGQTPERITDWTEIREILDANVNTNEDVKGFLDLVDAGSIDIKSGNIEGTVREESNRYVYDIKWIQYESTETKWPNGIIATTSNNYSISLTDTTLAGYSKKIIYARQGEEKTLAFQEGGGAENIDGFIWWYEKASQGNDPADKSVRLDWGSDIKIEDNATKSLTFKNGLAWLRGKHIERTFILCLQYPKTGQNRSWSADNTWTRWEGWSTNKVDFSPTSACQIKYTVPTDADAGTVYRVVFAGSTSNEIGAVANNTITPPEISVRTVYEIHVIDKERCEEELSNDITIPVDDEAKMEAFKKKFVASYEVYKPYGSGTNFRLAEPIGNYYVLEGNNTIASPQRVEWTAYGSDGQPLNPQPAITYHNNGEIVKLKFPQDEDKKTERATFYLIAKAVNSSGTKYAAAFRTVHLEPYAEVLTQSQIAEKANDIHYQERSEAYLERVDTRYEKIVDISFDGENIPGNLTVENNYLTSRPGVLTNPSYAFANPGDYTNRKNSRRSVGRGEYAFYRTLNHTGISTTTQGYNDYFMRSGDDAIKNSSMVDRTKEKGGDWGYFMYLDATDEPGVITKIDVGTLCPHTTLIASAWICDMAHSADVTHADVGFTFKWRDENGTETILAKYYSGAIDRSFDENEIAQWKQIFFKFKITDVPTGKGTYVLEIANNTPNSNGADYGIDDIQVWRSLPDIRVQREDACNASTLRISSAYETILNNLGWDQDEEVINRDELSDPNRRKYRYGLMNSNSFANVDTLQYALKTGNVYFSFAYPNPTDSANGAWGQDTDDWVTVNKNLLDGSGSDDAIRKGNYHKTIRVALPTDMLDADKPEGAWSKLPTTAEEAYRREVMLNVYAMNDFIADTKRGPANSSTPYWDPDTDTNGAFGLEQFITDFKTLCKVSWREDQSLHRVEEVYVEAIINNTGGLLDTYNRLKKKMYVYLGIPRVRFPWRSENGTEIFLTNIYVDNTDLRYKGEQRPGEETPATGEYYVILFSASTVAGTHGDSEAIKNSFNLADPCRLKSLFTVLPATTIKIDTDLENPTTAICEGNLKKITATLNGYDIDGNDVDLKDNGINYIFDWYLSSMEAYETDAIENDNVSIKSLLEAYRSLSKNYGPITIADLDDWSGENTVKERLKDLIQDGLLKTGTTGAETFDLFINVPEIVAMPYVYENDGGDNYTFCTDKTSVLFDLSEEGIPDMPTGISGVTYPFTESAPLRLGQLHLGAQTKLNIPVRKITGMSDLATHIGLNERKEVLLNNASTTLPTVGTVSLLHIDKPTDKDGAVSNATITIQWEQEAKARLQEGQSYELLIPFAQYDAKGLLTSACEGLASLTVKVVPEYLTWKGTANNAWYNDNNWHQSTEAELYMGDKAADKDANGTDEISNAFAPLYFTKITIPGNSTLPLEDVTKDSETNALALNDNNATPNIQFDMAVADANGTITSYYINRVSEIYFKPEAKLMNQHYLDYEKAWVEFEIANSGKRWMTSPLQNVYAGDIYAPSANGRQETEAFEDIRYNTTSYSRWSPAFYQKAWNKAIQYATDEAGSDMTSVAAVKSNWSIEYNDVRVPYTPGKGFYLSVEDIKGDGTALVRLPKADTEYTYEAKTKALRSGENLNKTNAGKLVALSEGSYTLKLTTAVDGDGKHFLVGNPFMTYLDMAEFFEANEDVLAPKYWTLANGAPNAIVGTPDIDFEGESANGTVEPMQAFFVELKEGATLTENTSITFNANMMSANKAEPTEVTTKSASATHPVITLTAERGNEKSVARLLTSDKADNGYKADEDAVVLLDSELDAPMVYTVSGSQAAQVNAVKSVKNVGLGVFSEGNDEVTVTIEGLSRMAEPLYLYDAQTRKSVKLESDSYSLQISGDSHGRYFLRDSDLGSELENTISIYSARQGQVIVSALRPVKEIRVFGLNGSQARRFSVNTTQYSFNLPAGIYMIYASDGEQEHTEKVLVR